MLKKYSEFINESFDLILESDVVYSDKFRKVLSRMSKDGDPVSKALLDIENTDQPVQSNYFDIQNSDGKDSNDSITFIPERKIKEEKDKIEKSREELKDKYTLTSRNRYLNNVESNQAIWDALGLDMRNTNIGESEPPLGTVGIIGKSTISPGGRNFVEFIPDNKEYKPYPLNIEALSKGSNITDSNNYFKLSRQSIRVGRGVRSILSSAKIPIVDKEIESFVNKYKATVDNMNDIFSHFELVDGDSISEWYSYDTYEHGTRKGTLGSSCMADVGSEFFDIYTENPEVVSLLIYKSPENTEKIRGRSLVWKLKSGITFMDRIYTHDDSDVELFRQFAKKSGWYSKYKNSSTDSGKCFKPDGNIEEIEIVVHVSSGQYDKYPYLDTLKYYHTSSGKLSNTKSGNCIILEDTDGDYVRECEECGGDGEVSCEYCDGSGRRECRGCDGDGKVDCPECDGNETIDCPKCEGSGEITIDGVKSKCPDCNKGKIDCPKCEGNGNIECSSCDGDGEYECDECGGSGHQSCPECG
jgi:hypothetical protein